MNEQKICAGVISGARGRRQYFGVGLLIADQYIKRINLEESNCCYVRRSTICCAGREFPFAFVVVKPMGLPLLTVYYLNRRWANGMQTAGERYLEQNIDRLEAGILPSCPLRRSRRQTLEQMWRRKRQRQSVTIIQWARLLFRCG